MLAACTHPHFKANWIASKVEKEDAIKKLKLSVSDASTPLAERSETTINDFLSFPTNENTKPTEMDYFLNDPDQSIECLNKYPAIKELYIKFNTPIPSSAPVERLFSQTALVITIRRNQISDPMLEILLLLKTALKL